MKYIVTCIVTSGEVLERTIVPKFVYLRSNFGQGFVYGPSAD